MAVPVRKVHFSLHVAGDVGANNSAAGFLGSREKVRYSETYINDNTQRTESDTCARHS